MLWYNMETNNGVQLDVMAISDIIRDEQLDLEAIKAVQRHISDYYFQDFHADRQNFEEKPMMRLYVHPGEKSEVIKEIDKIIDFKAVTL